MKIIEITTTNGISHFTVDFCTASGQISDVMPSSRKIFIMLLPTIFPTASAAESLKAAVRLTAVSGALVPIATMVKPITS